MMALFVRCVYYLIAWGFSALGKCLRVTGILCDLASVDK